MTCHEVWNTIHISMWPMNDRDAFFFKVTWYAHCYSYITLSLIPCQCVWRLRGIKTCRISCDIIGLVGTSFDSLHQLRIVKYRALLCIPVCTLMSQTIKATLYAHRRYTKSEWFIYFVFVPVICSHCLNIWRGTPLMKTAYIYIGQCRKCPFKG